MTPDPQRPPTIHTADLLDWLRGRQWLAGSGYLPKAHAVLCDPPYFLGSISKRFGKPNSAEASTPIGKRMARGFMGQTWDGFADVYEYQAWVTEWAALMLSFVHPGALMLCFGGTRTFHRLAAGLEDAGWIVGDVIAWVYGSGFPKSHSISRAIDREAGEERETIGRTPGARNGNGKNNDYGSFKSAADGMRDITAPATPAAIRWQGYGTALKPAYEPVIIARAPWSGTYAHLAQQYGTGAINVDGGRIGTESTPRKDPRNGNLTNAHLEMRPWMKERIEQGLPLKGDFDGEQGRWPSNFILGCACESDEHRADCPVGLLDAQSGESSESPREIQHLSGADIWGNSKPGITTQTHGDSGTASRFFMNVKISPSCVLCNLPIGVESSRIQYHSTGETQWQNASSADKNTTNGEQAIGSAQEPARQNGPRKNEANSPSKNGPANTAENPSRNTSPTGIPTAQESAPVLQSVQSALSARFAESLCDSCITAIAQSVVALLQEKSPVSSPGLDFMPERNAQILNQNLAAFVGNLESTDITTITTNLNKLLGTVQRAIENIIADPITASCQSRFRYVSKSAKWEREAGLDHRTARHVNDGRDTPIDNPYQRGETQRLNVHPTVKPIALTEYLARLILPPALETPRRLLVPFAGVASEMIGALLAGWDVITGIEQSAEYAAIGRQRLAWWAQFKSYEQAKRAWEADHVEEQTRRAEQAAGVAQLALFPEASR